MSNEDTFISNERVQQLPCPCFFNMDPDIHDRLTRLEELGPLEALHLVAELAMCEFHPGFDAGDFSSFAAQHNWQDASTVGNLAFLLDDLSKGYCRGKSRVSI